MPIFQLRKVSKIRKGSYNQYLLTLPKAFGDTLTSVGVEKILLILNNIGIIVPVRGVDEAEEIKRSIYSRYDAIEKLIPFGHNLKPMIEMPATTDRGREP